MTDPLHALRAACTHGSDVFAMARGGDVLGDGVGGLSCLLGFDTVEVNDRYSSSGSPKRRGAGAAAEPIECEREREWCCVGAFRDDDGHEQCQHVRTGK
jgi:hypothetical protein